MAGNGGRQQKKQQIFFRLTAFAGRAGGGWYSVLKVWADWLDNLGFVYLTNWNLYNYSSNFPHFIGFPACPLVK